MPDFSGFSVGAFLRDFDQKHTPILIYSSRPLAELQATAVKIGAVGFLEKTRPLTVLRTLVTQILHERAA
jgi:FixJ family two-component response regulator